MRRKFGLKLLLLGMLFGTSGCQYFYDGRHESLLLVPAAEWSELHQFKKQQRAEKIMAARPVAVEGAEQITFSNMSDAYLAGCRSLGIVEVHHQGPYDDAMILMRNQAVELEASIIVPLDMYENTNEMGEAGPEMTFVQGRVLRCPDKNSDKEV